MSSRTHPVLTGVYCGKMEKLRQVIEVLFGERAVFVNIDFNTGRSKIRIKTREIEMIFPDFELADRCHIGIETDSGSHDWYTVRFDMDVDSVAVISDRNPVKKGPDQQHSMWWIGSSATDRRLYPLDLENVRYCAGLRGLTIENYLELDK